MRPTAGGIHAGWSSGSYFGALFHQSLNLCITVARYQFQPIHVETLLLIFPHLEPTLLLDSRQQICYLGLHTESTCQWIIKKRVQMLAGWTILIQQDLKVHCDIHLTLHCKMIMHFKIAIFISLCDNSNVINTSQAVTLCKDFVPLTGRYSPNQFYLFVTTVQSWQAGQK